MDNRPKNCRNRLKEEGKAYPKSSCPACGATLATGLGECLPSTLAQKDANKRIDSSDGRALD